MSTFAPEPIVPAAAGTANAYFGAKPVSGIPGNPPDVTELVAELTAVDSEAVLADVIAAHNALLAALQGE